MALTKNIDVILSEVGREIGYVQKGGTNKAQSYKYASAEQVLKKANEALFSRGVSVSSSAEIVYFNVEKYERTNDYGTKTLFRTDAAVHLSLTFHLGGETRTVEGVGSATDTGDKAVFKANTGALKYVLANAFLISWGDDPEADESVDKEAAPPKKPAAKKRAPAKAKKAKAAPVVEVDANSDFNTGDKDNDDEREEW